MQNPAALVGIARVSTAGQAEGRAAGLDRQVESIRRIAAIHAVPEDRLTIIQIADVGGSDLAQTPEWNRDVLPRLMEPGTHLAVDAVDRIIRPDGFDFAIFMALQATNSRIYTPAGPQDLRTPEGFLGAGIRALFGGMEKMEFKRRAYESREKKRKRGEFCQAKVCLPHGVDYDFKSGEWGYTADAPSVKRAFTSVVREGMPLGQAARHLGVTQTGFRIILKNPIYRGIWRIDQKRGHEKYPSRDGRQPERKKVARALEEVIEVRVFGGEGQEPQLVEDATWHAAQDIIARNKLQHRRCRRSSEPHIWASTFLYSAREELPSPHIFTFDTGPIRPRAHVLHGYTSRGEHWYRCHCRTGKAGLESCALPLMPAVEVNRALDRLFTSISRSGKFQRDVIDAAAKAVGGSEITAERTQLMEKIAGEEKKRQRVLEGFEAGLYGVDEAKKKVEAIKADVATLQAQLDRLGSRDPAAEQEATQAHFASIEMWNEGWGREQRITWMRRYVSGVVVSTLGVDKMILRLPRADGTIEEREHTVFFTWKQLGLSYDPMSREARAAGRQAEEGVYKTGHIAAVLGVNENRVRYLVRSGQIEAPTGREGLHRVWDKAAFIKAVEMGKALS